MGIMRGVDEHCVGSWKRDDSSVISVKATDQLSVDQGSNAA